MPRMTSKAVEFVEVTFTEEEAHKILIDAARAEMSTTHKVATDGPMWVRPDGYRGFIVTLKKA